MGKKNPYVFTIGFDKKNPEHLEVVKLLNGTEKKAALIAEAILQYTGKKSGGDTGVSQEASRRWCVFWYGRKWNGLLARLLFQTLELQAASSCSQRQKRNLPRP